MASTDISAEIATLNEVATALGAALNATGCVVVAGQAAQLGQVAITLSDLADVATQESLVTAVDPEAPPVYGNDGQLEPS